jgi:hypothetical protein
MFLKRKRPEDKAAADRQLMVFYKKIFGGEEGQSVLIDLMNRYWVLNSHGGDAGKEGERRVVLDIMARANIDLAKFDKLLKGEIS